MGKFNILSAIFLRKQQEAETKMDLVGSSSTLEGIRKEDQDFVLSSDVESGASFRAEKIIEEEVQKERETAVADKSSEIVSNLSHFESEIEEVVDSSQKESHGCENQGVDHKSDPGVYFEKDVHQESSGSPENASVRGTSPEVQFSSLRSEDCYNGSERMFNPKDNYSLGKLYGLSPISTGEGSGNSGKLSPKSAPLILDLDEENEISQPRTPNSMRCGEKRGDLCEKFEGMKGPGTDEILSFQNEFSGASKGNFLLESEEHQVENSTNFSLDENMARVFQWVQKIDDFEGGNEEEVENFAPENEVHELDIPESLDFPSGLTENGEVQTKILQRLSLADKRTQTINLGSQQLKTAPPLGLFSNLKYLSLANNSISSIPPGFLPKSLHTLNLSRNGLLGVEGFKDLTRLRVLNLSHNKITRIGHGLSGCTSLRELYFSHNKISEVEGLHRLLKLTILDISHNRLATTKSISQLAANYNNLKAFSILGNPVMANVGLEAINKYIRGLLPHLIYYNDQRVKPLTSREGNSEGPIRTPISTASLVYDRKVPTSRPSARVSKGNKGKLSSGGQVSKGRSSQHSSRRRDPSEASRVSRKVGSKSLPSSGRLEATEVDFSLRAT